MKSPRMIWAIFVTLVVVQLAVPALHIVTFENVLRRGVLFRFRCAPVDPFDAFRGRFVRVNPEVGSASWGGREMPKRGQTVYVTLREGDDGFAGAVMAYNEPPAQGDYIAAYYRFAPSNGFINVELPFDRFYMPEKLAARAERLYGQHTRSTNAWLAVRIRNGLGVIENIYVEGQPLADLARKRQDER